MSGYNLSHLRQLEAESIHIIREVAAEFANPVMLYSVGKDSSVMLHLAHKAFAPGRIPFPLMHIDTQWKFQEMYRFRAEMAERYKVEIKVWINPEGKDKVSPFTHGSGTTVRRSSTSVVGCIPRSTRSQRICPTMMCAS